MNRVMNHRLLAAAILCAPIGFAAPAMAQQPAERSLTEIAPDLYRFQDNLHYGVVLVTEEGIVVADTLNRNAAEWLKSELDSRFDVPVRYVLYSHHHADHASGAAVFEGAVVVAHEAAIAPLTPPGADAPLPPQYAAADTNGDGLLQRDEAPPNVAARFDDLDADNDGALTARELFALQFGRVSPFGGVRIPDETYSGPEHEIELGGQTVRMVHVDAAHAADSSLIIFPEQRVLFVSDLINIKRMPFMTLPGFTWEDLDLIVDATLAQDFDIVAPGHGDLGGPEDVERFRQYHRDLFEGVQAGLDAGRSLEEIQETLLLEDYSDWAAYDDWRALNIEGAHRILTTGS